MIFACTRLRMSVMARCAATPRICDRPKLVMRLDDGRRARRQRDRHQQVVPPLADHVVDDVLRQRRQHDAGQAADHHQRQADRQPPAMHPDQLAELAPRRRRVELLLGGRAGSPPRRDRLERAAAAPFRSSHDWARRIAEVPYV